MSIFFAFVLFGLGLFLGSFLNVLIDRLPRGEKITGRSHCDHCKRVLSAKDLIPIVSFVYLRGRCRYCHTKLSYQFPLLELLTGILFAATYLLIANTPSLYSLIFHLCVVSSLIVIFFADQKYGIIPDEILIFSSIVTFAYLLLFQLSALPIHLLLAFACFLFFLFIYILTKGRGMGFGDVKFAFVLGLILGYPGSLVALYIAFLTGGTVGIILILWKKKKLASAVPFGPFLVVGTLISLFFTQEIVGKALALL